MQRILIVDDEYDIREMLIDFLKMTGYEVVTAVNGEEGFNLFQKQKFDAAILDIKMPKMNGIECARKIKKIKPDFPILMMTGVLEFYSEDEIFAIGVNDLILKPLDIKEIGRILKKYFS